MTTPRANLRTALRWISDRRKERPGDRLGPLLDEASLKFDLSPAEGDWLIRALATGNEEDAPKEDE